MSTEKQKNTESLFTKADQARQREEARALVPVAPADAPVVAGPGRDPSLPFVETLGERYRLAKYIAAGGLAPSKKPETILTIMLKGYELGVPPMMALGNIHVIDGRPSLSADLMCALVVQRAGVTYKVVEDNDERVRIIFSRPGWEDYEASYSYEEAKTAGLTTKHNWKHHRRQMLAARAKSIGCRMIGPDILAGDYSYEEVRDFDRAPATAEEREEKQKRLDAIADDLAGDSQEPTEEIEAEEVPEPTRPPVQEDDEDEQREKARRHYFALMNELAPADWTDENRRAFQKKHAGKESTKDFELEDFQSMIDVLEAEKQRRKESGSSPVADGSRAASDQGESEGQAETPAPASPASTAEEKDEKAGKQLRMITLRAQFNAKLNERLPDDDEAAFWRFMKETGLGEKPADLTYEQLEALADDEGFDELWRGWIAWAEQESGL